MTTISLPRRGPRRRVHTATRVWNILGVTVAALIALLWLMPLLWAVDTAFKPEEETATIPISWIPTHFTTDAFQKVFAESDVVRWFLNSTVVTVAVTLLVLVT